jgi:hypothetical protein
MAPFERTRFCYMRIGDWNFGFSDELWDAGHRRRKSSGGDYFVWDIFSIRVVQGVLAYPAARGGAAPRVDDSDFFDWDCGGCDSPDHRNVFCNESSYRSNAAGIFRDRVLDRLCAAPDCGGGLDTDDASRADGGCLSEIIRRFLDARVARMFVFDAQFHQEGTVPLRSKASCE